MKTIMTILGLTLVSFTAFASPDVTDDCRRIVSDKIAQAGLIPTGNVDMYALGGEKTIYASFGEMRGSEFDFVTVSIKSSVCSVKPTGYEKIKVIEIDPFSDLKGAFGK